MNIRSFSNSHKGLLKFLALLAVLLGYFGFLSWKYDIVTGGVVSALTWSFFVVGTPIADAGFLLDFPVRLITGMNMIYSEMIVWTLAIGINTAVMLSHPEFYQKSVLTKLLHKIITHPWPYGIIVLLCAAGTYLSVWVGDDVMDKTGNKKDKGKRTYLKWAGMACIFAVIFVSYYFVLKSLNVDIGQVL